MANLKDVTLIEQIEALGENDFLLVNHEGVARLIPASAINAEFVGAEKSGAVSEHNEAEDAHATQFQAHNEAEDAHASLFEAKQDKLPAITAEDAGKFLRVSAEGQWVVEAVPAAEEASF